MRSDKSTRILIADDHPIFRKGLRAVIDGEPGFTVVGEAENGGEVLDLIEVSSPDIVILDVDMPVKDGIEAAKLIRGKYPDLKLLFLTLHKDREILNALNLLNVHGYLLKDGALVEIIACIKSISKGQIYISPTVSDLFVSDPGASQRFVDVQAYWDRLTPTEYKILLLVADSMSNKDIAEQLFISVRTVENHRFNICAKLQLRGNNALLKFALTNRERILDSPLNVPLQPRL